MVQYLALHEGFTQDASLLLDVAFKDGEWSSVLRLRRAEGSQIDLRYELEHAPAKHLTVFILELIFDQLGRVHVHQHRVNEVTQAGHLGFLWNCRGSTFSDWEVGWLLEHFVHIRSPSMGISSRCP